MWSIFFFFSSRRRHTRLVSDWSSDVCSSDLSAEYKAMGTQPIVESQTGSYRYEAIVRISETIAACREPEEMATTLASEIGKFLHFDHLYFVVLKENSTEI